MPQNIVLSTCATTDIRSVRHDPECTAEPISHDANRPGTKQVASISMFFEFLMSSLTPFPKIVTAPEVGLILLHV